MSDQRPTSDQPPQPAQPPAQQPVRQPAQEPPAQPAAGDGSPRTGPPTRSWSLRTVVATAITAVALSGAGGAALAAVSDGSTVDDGRMGRPGSGAPGRLNGQLPGQVPGQLQNGQQVGQRDGQLQPPQTGGVPGRPPSASTSGGRDT